MVTQNVTQKFCAMILVCVTMLGCGSGKLVPDQSIPSTDAHYATAEINACGRRFHGLGVCALEKNKDIADLEISVQGYYGGTVQWYSQGCGVDYSEEYAGNDVIRLKLAGKINKSCIISVTVSPKYTPEMTNDLAVYSFRGHLAVKLSPGGAWLGETRKLSGNWQDNLKIPVQGGTAAQVVFRGCNRTYKAELPILGYYVDVPLREAANIAEGAPCLLDGFALNKLTDLTVNALLQVNSSLYSPLSIPIIESGETLRVTAEAAVSVISLDNQFVLSSSAKFKNFNEQLPHVLRLLTVKGRSVLCEYTPVVTTPPPGPKGGWRCLQ